MVMNQPERSRPSSDDLVLGGTQPPPSQSLVLGGWNGVKHRLQSSEPEARSAALVEATAHGDAGLNCILQALQDKSEKVQQVAYDLLQQRHEFHIRPVLKAYRRVVEQLLADYAAGDRNFRGAALRWANLSRAYLVGADLSEAALRGADLYEANLSYANLSNADLRGADLGRANLYRANLSGANFSGTDLNRANLWGAKISAADLSEAIFNKTRMPDGDYQTNMT